MCPARSLRAILPLVCLLGLAPPVISQDFVKGTVTADNLNVRDKPAIDAEVIGTLNKGDQVAGRIEGEWVKTMLKNKQFGYFSSQFFSTAKESPRKPVSAGKPGTARAGKARARPAKACELDVAKSTITIDSAELDCQEDVVSGVGYEYCDATLNISAAGNCRQDMQLSMDCEVTLSYALGGQYISTSKKSLQKSVQVALDQGEGSTTVKIRWQPEFAVNKVTKAKLLESECRNPGIVE